MSFQDLMTPVIISGWFYGFSSPCSFLSIISWLSCRSGKNQIHFTDNSHIFFLPLHPFVSGQLFSVPICFSMRYSAPWFASPLCGTFLFKNPITLISLSNRYLRLWKLKSTFAVCTLTENELTYNKIIQGIYKHHLSVLFPVLFHIC